MRIQAKIQKWGNSLGIRLSGPIKAIPQFKEDMLVDVDVTEEGISIRPKKKKKRKKLPFSEIDLLDGLTVKTSHADELAFLNDKEF